MNDNFHLDIILKGLATKSGIDRELLDNIRHYALNSNLIYCLAEYALWDMSPNALREFTDFHKHEQPILMDNLEFKQHLERFFKYNTEIELEVKSGNPGGHGDICHKIEKIDTGFHNYGFKITTMSYSSFAQDEQEEIMCLGDLVVWMLEKANTDKWRVAMKLSNA